MSATFKVRDKVDRNFPPSPENVALPPPTINFAQLSWGKFRWKPATRQLDESFAALVKSPHRFARQNVYWLPAVVKQPSPCSTKVRRLSGSKK